MNTEKLDDILKGMEESKSTISSNDKKGTIIYNEKIEALADVALEDGVLTDKERDLLLRKAQQSGIDPDEFEMILDSRLTKMQKEKKAKAQALAQENKEKQDKKEKSKRGGRITIFVIVGLVVIGGIVGGAVWAFKANSEKQGKAEAAISNNDLTTAYNIMKDLVYIKEDLAELYIRKCFELNEIDKVEMIYSSLSDNNKKSIRSIVQKEAETAISNNNLSTAYNIINKDEEVKSNLADLYIRKCYELKEDSKAELFYNSLSNKGKESARSVMQERAETLISNNDLTTAYNIMNNDAKIKANLTEVYIRKCYELNEVGKAEMFYNSLSDKEKENARSVLQGIVESLILKNDLTTAYNIMKNDAQIMNNLADVYISKCYELNEVGKVELFYNTLQKEAETAIRNKDLTTAYNIMKKNDRIMNNLSELYIRKCLELNKDDNAESFYNSLSKEKRNSLRTILYDYYLKKDNYDKAEKYTKFYNEPLPNSEQYAEEHYAYIVDVVTAMCKAGRKEEAKSYAKGLIEKYNWRDKNLLDFIKSEKYSKEAVTERITEFIENY